MATNASQKMDRQMDDVLAGIKKGIDLDGIQECMNLDDNTLYAILVELNRLEKIKIEAIVKIAESSGYELKRGE